MFQISHSEAGNQQSSVNYIVDTFDKKIPIQYSSIYLGHSKGED